MWAGLDSNQCRLSPANLQSAPFSHSGTDPYCKATTGIRTQNNLFTKQALCQIELWWHCLRSIPHGQSNVQDCVFRTTAKGILRRRCGVVKVNVTCVFVSDLHLGHNTVK